MIMSNTRNMINMSTIKNMTNMIHGGNKKYEYFED